jgi:uncharacterized membrane protein
VSAPGASALAGLLAFTGTTHFLSPAPFDRIVPTRLPGTARGWTYASGAAELAMAAALASPGSRASGGFAAAALFVAVFPANVKMAVDTLRDERASPALKAAVTVRLPLQVPLVAWALRVSREAR